MDVERQLERTLTQISHDIKATPPATPSRKRMLAEMEDEEADLESYEDGLDPVVGWLEWKALVATFERALMWLPVVSISSSSPSFVSTEQCHPQLRLRCLAYG